MAILVSDKTEFKAKNIKQEKEGHFMIKELIHAVYSSHKPLHTNQQYSQIHRRISFKHNIKLSSKNKQQTT